MPHPSRFRFKIVAALIAISSVTALPATTEPNAQPNPYRTIENWAKLPEGRTWGSAAGVDLDSHGHIWVAERCGKDYPGTCADSHLAPILEFDPSGKLLTAFGADMFVFPHGITADKDGNVWVTDEQGVEGKGYQAIKFSPNFAAAYGALPSRGR